jgi:multidrug efflux pump subunit AcrB
MAQAAREMEGPMVGGTLTTVVVFLPFSVLAKQTQLLFAGISFTVTASLFASLFVALSLVPALGELRIRPSPFQRNRVGRVGQKTLGTGQESFLSVHPG